MALQVKLKLEVEGGKKITRIKQLVIVQDLFRHHQFEMIVAFTELEKKGEIFFHDAHKDLCGKTISVSMEPVSGPTSSDFSFRGVVTEITLSSLSDFSSVFIVKGYSPTILLEDSSIRRIFLKKNLQQVFDEVLSDYPGNVIRKKLKPSVKKTIPCLVQYDETNFEFMNRLAAEYGEWFYYNGQDLILGSTGPSPEVEFMIDGNQSFDMSVTLLPAKFSMSAYDYRKDQHYEGRSSGQTIEGLGSFSRFALDESESLFSRETSVIAAQTISNQHDLNDLIKFRRNAIASKLILFHGRGEFPNLTVGTVISVTSTKPEKGGRSEKESVGRYRILEITHNLDSNGNYSSVFKAVPETARFPPPNPWIRDPAGQPELATVSDNNDPDKMNRVKVVFHWPGKNSESDWIRVGNFYTGGDDRKGMQFIPEKEAQVMVGYERDKPGLPFIMSSMYPKKEGMRSRKGNNEEKCLYTKAGNLIELNDKPGENKIQITNVNNADSFILMEFKDDGVITLKTKGVIHIEAGGNISIHAGDKLLLEANEIEMKTQKSTKISAGSFSVTADTSAEMSAKASAKITSANTEVSGDAMTTIQGGIVKIN